MDKLTGIAMFVRVVEEQSFSKAADSLGLSKSTVSKQIRRLEDRLGVRLLNRTTRSMSLTEAGQTFYERCREIIEQAEQAELEVAAAQDEPAGRLSVSAPMSFGQRHVAPTLAPLLQRHPKLKLDLTLTDEQVDIVAEGYDVALRIAKLPDSSLIARRLAAAPRVLVGSPEYLERRGTPSHPRDLAEHDCLLYSLQRSGDSWVFQRGDEVDTVRVQGSLRANNGDVLRRAVVDGLGMTMLPTFLVDDEIADGRLVRVLPEWDDLSLAVYAVYPHSRHVSTKVRAFVDFLVERYRTAAWSRTPPTRSPPA